MNPKIESKGPLHFVGISDTFISIHSPDATNFEVIPALWGRFDVVCGQVVEPVGDLSYGIIYKEEKRSRPDELRYLAACRIENPWTETDEKLSSFSTEAANYAIFEHRGPIAGIGETLRKFHEWLEASDYENAGCFEIEVYPSVYNPASEDTVMETWIPVSRKN